MEASSIHTSLFIGSPKTTTASLAPAISFAPLSLQTESRSSFSASSTRTNSQDSDRFDEGAMSAASMMVFTSSEAISCSVNLRVLRRNRSNS